LRLWQSATADDKKDRMVTFFYYVLVPLGLGAVAVVLLLGLINMMRGGSANVSQRLMRLRVLLQFVALVIIMITLALMGR
jgi:hypoxia induced protein